MKVLLIRDEMMPKNCMECKLQYYDEDSFGYCVFTDVECLSIGRQDVCPLIEIEINDEVLKINNGRK